MLFLRLVTAGIMYALPTQSVGHATFEILDATLGRFHILIVMYNGKQNDIYLYIIIKGEYVVI